MPVKRRIKTPVPTPAVTYLTVAFGAACDSLASKDADRSNRPRGDSWICKGDSTVAGRFEILRGNDGAYRFRLTAADGTLVAESPQFKQLSAAVAGINAVRENAATGFVVDCTK